MVVVIADGPNAGTYTGTSDPGCAVGVSGDDVWNVNYGNLAAGPAELSMLQITDTPDTTGRPNDRIFSAFLTIGSLFGGTSYTLSLDRFSAGKYVHEIQDNGTTALIHAAGKSLATPLGPGDVSIDVTVNCPTVLRK